MPPYYGQMAEIVVPGQRLGGVDEFNAGSGTYERHGALRAARLGAKTLIPAQVDGEVSSGKAWGVTNCAW